MVVAVVAAGCVGWNAWAATARHKVQVLIDAEAFSCESSGDVTSKEALVGSGNGATLNVPALVLSPGLACRFEFVLRNTGGRKVVLNELIIPFMGSNGGTGLQAMMLDSFMLNRVDDGGLDARFVFPRGYPTVLEGGEDLRISALLAWQDGCIEEGGSMTVDDAPRLKVSALGLPGEILHGGGSYAMIGTVFSMAANCGWEQRGQGE
ncbi:hypothetical protein GCM10023166_35780 [Paeniglutamicibacter cryotolerans]